MQRESFGWMVSEVIPEMQRESFAVAKTSS